MIKKKNKNDTHEAHMHIILGILAVLGIGFTILWRLSVAAQAAQDIASAAGDARGLFRRFLWWRKVNKDIFQSIEDPKEAAATMMVALAESDGLISVEEQNKIFNLMQTTFNISHSETQELYARAKWLSREAQSKDLLSFMKRLTPVIKKTCGDEQKHELLLMLNEVAHANGDISQVDKHLLMQLRQNLDLPPMH